MIEIKVSQDSSLQSISNIRLDQSPPSEAVTQAAEALPAGWEERTVTMSYYVNESTGASTWERPEMSTTITENQGKTKPFRFSISYSVSFY